MAHDEANEPNGYGSNDGGTRYDDALHHDGSDDDGKSDYDGYDALYDGNESNDEPNWYDGSNDDGSNDGNGSNDEPNWYDGNATGNTEQIKIHFFFI